MHVSLSGSTASFHSPYPDPRIHGRQTHSAAVEATGCWPRSSWCNFTASILILGSLPRARSSPPPIASAFARDSALM